MTDDSFRTEISQAIARERRTYILSWLLTGICLALGASWMFYSYQQVRQLEGTRLELIQTIDRLKTDIENQNAEKKRLEELIRQRRGIADSLANVKGKRKVAIDLAYDLQDRGYGFVAGGRKPEDKGFDMSGFIDYILSRPEIGVIKQADVPNCNIQCLMNYRGITTVSALSQLRPGDLIFYPEWNTTMLYLGGTNSIGMMWNGKIEIKEDINFGPNPRYAKVSYEND